MLAPIHSSSPCQPPLSAKQLLLSAVNGGEAPLTLTPVYYIHRAQSWRGICSHATPLQPKRCSGNVRYRDPDVFANGRKPAGSIHALGTLVHTSSFGSSPHSHTIFQIIMTNKSALFSQTSLTRRRNLRDEGLGTKWKDSAKRTTTTVLMYQTQYM